MSALETLAAVRHVIAGALVLIGLLAFAGGVLANLRFPDFFTRLHGAILAAFASGVVLAGLAVEAWDGRIALRLLLLALLVAVLAPLRAHLLMSGAHGAGLAPKVGRLL
jgi:multicomponent Na+:H+ antiporter subunit G